MVLEYMGSGYIIKFVIYLGMKFFFFLLSAASFGFLAVSKRFNAFCCVDSKPRAKQMRLSPL